jgi:hypothetical protein
VPEDLMLGRDRLAGSLEHRRPQHEAVEATMTLVQDPEREVPAVRDAGDGESLILSDRVHEPQRRLEHPRLVGDPIGTLRLAHARQIRVDPTPARAPDEERLQRDRHEVVVAGQPWSMRIGRPSPNDS